MKRSVKRKRQWSVEQGCLSEEVQGLGPGPENIWGWGLKISPLRAKTPLFLKVRALCHKRGDGQECLPALARYLAVGAPPTCFHHTYAQSHLPQLHPQLFIYYNSMVLLQGSSGLLSLLLWQDSQQFSGLVCVSYPCWSRLISIFPLQIELFLAD